MGNPLEGQASSNRPKHTPAEPLTRCPGCGDPIAAVTIRGPQASVATPCGCRISDADLETLED